MFVFRWYFSSCFSLFKHYLSKSKQQQIYVGRDIFYKHILYLFVIYYRIKNTTQGCGFFFFFLMKHNVTSNLPVLSLFFLYFFTTLIHWYINCSFLLKFSLDSNVTAVTSFFSYSDSSFISFIDSSLISRILSWGR